MQEECNQGSFPYNPAVNPAVSQLLSSIDLCRRNIVLPSHVLLLICGGVVWKLTLLPPQDAPNALMQSEKCPVKSL